LYWIIFYENGNYENENKDKIQCRIIADKNHRAF